jgi:hypothetical protein
MLRAPISRRLFLGGGIGLSAMALPRPKSEVAYTFAIAGSEARMTVAYYDRYSATGFRFQELLAGRNFCLSAAGDEDRQCLPAFFGSLAVACYRFAPGPNLRGIRAIREHVQTIDRDTRLAHRPAFDRTIELIEGVASDIQAFGYETDPPASSASSRLPDAGGPWVYFRQELYFAGRSMPFLIVHWRHAFGGIRILDVIPGDGTRPVSRIPQ